MSKLNNYPKPVILSFNGIFDKETSENLTMQTLTRFASCSLGYWFVLVEWQQLPVQSCWFKVFHAQRIFWNLTKFDCTWKLALSISSADRSYAWGKSVKKKCGKKSSLILIVKLSLIV